MLPKRRGCQHRSDLFFFWSGENKESTDRSRTLDNNKKWRQALGPGVHRRYCSLASINHLRWNIPCGNTWPSVTSRWRLLYEDWWTNRCTEWRAHPLIEIDWRLGTTHRTAMMWVRVKLGDNQRPRPSAVIQRRKKTSGGYRNYHKHRSDETKILIW